MFNIIAPTFSELVSRTKKCRMMNDARRAAHEPPSQEDDDEREREIYGGETEKRVKGDSRGSIKAGLRVYRGKRYVANSTRPKYNWPKVAPLGSLQFHVSFLTIPMKSAGNPEIFENPEIPRNLEILAQREIF